VVTDAGLECSLIEVVSEAGLSNLIEVVTEAGLTNLISASVTTSIKLESNLHQWPPLLSYSQTCISDHLYYVSPTAGLTSLIEVVTDAGLTSLIEVVTDAGLTNLISDHLY
jgi:uncharacterized protein YidB (DUF937 family)